MSAITSNNSLISQKDRDRLTKVREMLNNGASPYEVITTKRNEDKSATVTKHTRHVINQVETTARVTSKRVVVTKLDDYVPKSPLCMRCKVEITGLASHLVKVFSEYAKVVKEHTVAIVAPNYELLGIEEDQQYIRFPTFDKGLMCQSCCDSLYPHMWVDKDGVKHRVLEYLIEPVDHSRDFNADSFLPATSGLSGHPSKGRTTSGSRVKMKPRSDSKSGPVRHINPTTGQEIK